MLDLSRSTVQEMRVCRTVPAASAGDAPALTLPHQHGAARRSQRIKREALKILTGLHHLMRIANITGVAFEARLQMDVAVEAGCEKPFFHEQSIPQVRSKPSTAARGRWCCHLSLPPTVIICPAVVLILRRR